MAGIATIIRQVRRQLAHHLLKVHKVLTTVPVQEEYVKPSLVLEEIEILLIAILKKDDVKNNSKIVAGASNLIRVKKETAPLTPIRFLPFTSQNINAADAALVPVPEETTNPRPTTFLPLALLSTTIPSVPLTVPPILSPLQITIPSSASPILISSVSSVSSSVQSISIWSPLLSPFRTPTSSIATPSRKGSFDFPSQPIEINKLILNVSTSLAAIEEDQVEENISMPTPRNSSFELSGRNDMRVYQYIEIEEVKDAHLFVTPPKVMTLLSNSMRSMSKESNSFRRFPIPRLHSYMFSPQTPAEKQWNNHMLEMRNERWEQRKRVRSDLPINPPGVDPQVKKRPLLRRATEYLKDDTKWEQGVVAMEEAMQGASRFRNAIRKSIRLSTVQSAEPKSPTGGFLDENCEPW